ncbi:putative glycosidase C21B10.07 [Termitomyces sp. T112]|nr:putative glycosidase C21B10.07 [Termitomyces sp. T112]
MKPSTVFLAETLLAGVAIIAPVAATSYSLIKEYSGPTFFDDWTFFDHFDNLTNGDVVFVSASEAQSSKLAFVDPSTNHAIIKVDNTSKVPFNQKRNTVRITTDERYGLGSVWVADIFHIPYGCSVWPAWWSQAPDWPIGGEIDTLEGVNLVTQNQMGLHTETGCTIVNPSLLSTSKEGNPNCSFIASDNQGCIVTDTLPTSYGQGFAAAGGGVFVTEYAASGISYVTSLVADLISSSDDLARLFLEYGSCHGLKFPHHFPVTLLTHPHLVLPLAIGRPRVAMWNSFLKLKT